MDNQDHEALVDYLKSAYMRMAKVLALVAIPIRLEPLQDSVYAMENRESILHAHRILLDVPMSEPEMLLTSRMLLDWLVASEKLFEDAEESAEWRKTFVVVSLQRVYEAVLALEVLRSEE